jgi:threonine synthase
MNAATTSERSPDLDAIPGRLPTGVVCAGCGHRLADEEPIQLRCPRARPGDEIDHLLRRVLDPSRLAFPVGAEPNPFVRYRTLFHGYQVARSGGWSDRDVVALIERLDDDVARVDGRGFRETPFGRSEALSTRFGMAPHGGIFVKDETGNVSGSHKARHLFGTLLEMELAGGSATGVGHPLAIASCGNAALAAAVVARAAERRLQVFIPDDADPVVVARLRELGAELETCPRQAGQAGDPTYHRLLAALRAGAIGFTCQGNLNGLAIEGGETLGWEIVSALQRSGRHLDRVVVQVGGGALASSLVQALSEARDLGVLRRIPRIDTVQTRAAFPLARAYERLVARIGPDPAPAAVAAALDYAATHRSEFMWPWETAPHSLAHGILDDETYDWLAVLRGMVASGGRPLIVDEPTLADANRLARELTGIDVDPTGTAGFAGLLDLQRRGELDEHESVAVIFTGARRSGGET